MIQQIRESIIRKMGIEPDHIIPVKKTNFRKQKAENPTCPTRCGTERWGIS